MKKTLLSVCMITYNHENYVAQAIEGALMQKTSFDVELVIGEDCSTDGTRGIVFDYAKKYPEIVRIITSEKNVGAMQNFIRTLNACQGKYIALCEGDDYWTDPLKLQKQVDFLEANSEYGMVYSDIELIGESIPNSETRNLSIRRTRYKSGDIFFELLKRQNFINTCTVCFRKDLIDLAGINLKKQWYLFDYWFNLEIALKAKIKYMDAIFAKYRYHLESITKKTNILGISGPFVRAEMIKKYFKLKTPKLTTKTKNIIAVNIFNLLKNRNLDFKCKFQLLLLLVRYPCMFKNVFEVFLKYIANRSKKNAKLK